MSDTEAKVTAEKGIDGKGLKRPRSSDMSIGHHRTGRVNYTRLNRFKPHEHDPSMYRLYIAIPVQWMVWEPASPVSPARWVAEGGDLESPMNPEDEDDSKGALVILNILNWSNVLG